MVETIEEGTTFSSDEIATGDESEPVDLIEEVGSVTRARPGDENAPDRVSDFGPAAVDTLVQQRAEQVEQRDRKIAWAFVGLLAVFTVFFARD